MTKNYFAIIGSGTVPNIGPYHPHMSGAFPDGRYPQLRHEPLSRIGTGSIILNFEDASVSFGIDGQAITATSTALPLPASPLVGRRALAIHNNGPGTLYIGKIGVTTATGFPLASNEKIGIDIGGNQNVFVYGISDSTCDVRILELA